MRRLMKPLHLLLWLYCHILELIVAPPVKKSAHPLMMCLVF